VVVRQKPPSLQRCQVLPPSRGQLPAPAGQQPCLAEVPIGVQPLLHMAAEHLQIAHHQLRPAKDTSVEPLQHDLLIASLNQVGVVHIAAAQRHDAANGGGQIEGRGHIAQIVERFDPAFNGLTHVGCTLCSDGTLAAPGGRDGLPGSASVQAPAAAAAEAACSCSISRLSWWRM
jgi:hypothetical protein